MKVLHAKNISAVEYILALKKINTAGIASDEKKSIANHTTSRYIIHPPCNKRTKSKYRKPLEDSAPKGLFL